MAPPALADGVKVTQASAAQQRAAEKKLAEGKKLLEKGDSEAALARLRAAHEGVADPNISLLIATALRNTGDLLAAQAEYVRARREAEDAAMTEPKWQSTVTKAREGLAELESVLGRLSIKLVHPPQGTEVTVDGEPVPDAKLAEPLFVVAGSVTIEATAPDGRIVRQIVQMNAGERTAVELLFDSPEAPREPVVSEPEVASQASDSPPPSSGGKNYTPAFIAGGVGLAGFATFAVFGVLSNSKFDALQKDCPNGHCPPDRDDEIAAGKRYQTVANVGLGVGIAGVVTSTALFIFGARSGSGGPDRTASARVGVGVGLGTVEVNGAFQ